MNAADPDARKRLLARLSALTATRLRNDPELLELMGDIGELDAIERRAAEILAADIEHRIEILERAAEILEAEARTS